MQRLLAFASLALGLVPLCSAGQLPNVRLIDCETIPLKNLVNFDNCMVITFPNLNEYAGLDNLGESGNVMEGSLFSDEGAEIQGSHVSVSIQEEGVAEVMIADPNDAELYHMSVNLETGEVENIDLPPMSEGEAPLVAPDSPDVSDRTLLDRQLPEAGMVMKVLFVADAAFQAAFTNEGAMTDAINSILVHSKSFFAHGSLTTTITLQVLGTVKISETFLATGNAIDTFLQFTNGKVNSGEWPDADSYTLLSHQNNEGGTIGIAYFRSTCSTNRGLRTNINEYFNGLIRTAQIVVHEIGHNLGMDHDFQGDGSDRTADNGQPCTNEGGYMDYISNPTRWSQCSVEDFTKYHNAVVNSRGSWCLAAPGEQPSTPAPNPSTAGPEPNPSTAGPEPNPSTAGPEPNPTTPGPAPTCQKLSWINDGYCDDETNTPECFYDGHDCCVQKRDNWDEYCEECECIRPGPIAQEWPDCPRPDWVADTWCDDETNIPECNYDGGDCCFQRRNNWDRFCQECTCKAY